MTRITNNRVFALVSECVRVFVSFVYAPGRVCCDTGGQLVIRPMN
jgi:hypothetical protein